MSFKPMLAAQFDADKIKFPVLTSPKLDGVRITMVNGEALTRSLKKIPNISARSLFKTDAPLDGELIVGSPTSPTVFRDTMKVVMSHTAPIDELRFYAFDIVTANRFNERLAIMQTIVAEGGDRFLPVPHVQVDDLDQLYAMEEKCLENGFEGIMLRDPNGVYKYGRSTISDGGLIKLKRNLTSEAEIIGFDEQMHNANEATTNALGYTERSSHQANLVPLGTLGALQVRDIVSGVEFNIGTGFTAADRQDIWGSRHSLGGKIVTYKYLPVGVKDKPRHPVYLGFRDAIDLEQKSRIIIAKD